ncbi:MAG: hypothetical protein MUQ32_05815 [Chloroflexi bacterium]|nr:hypothetical protein [Chloroflexota bacterium]
MTGSPSASLLDAFLREGVLDAELAALAWLTLEGGIPIVVAGEAGTGRKALRDALQELLPAGARTVTLAGEAETFAWKAEAVELGWRHDGPWVPEADTERIRAGDGGAPVVLIADLEDRSDAATWGEHARLTIRSLAVGYGLAATATGTTLEDVLGRLASAPVGAIDDELTRLGVVLILGRDADGRRRVLAAHYLRPVARDLHGHIQRLPPAVLATWNPAAGRFEHFAWGVVGELAGRTGRRPVEFEREQAVRALELATRAADRPASIPPAPSTG